MATATNLVSQRQWCRDVRSTGRVTCFRTCHAMPRLRAPIWNDNTASKTRTVTFAEPSASPAEGVHTDAVNYTSLKVTIRKPLGLVLAEDEISKKVYVEEVVPGGNADQTGSVKVNDIVSRCSAVVLKQGKEAEYESEGYAQRPYTNWETIMFDCTGQDFDTVMAAIGSNNERWGIKNITLELLRPHHRERDE